MCISDIQYVKIVRKTSVEKYEKHKFCTFSDFFLDYFSISMAIMLFPKRCICKFIMAFLDYLSFQF